jgi:hypothetical protein
MTPGMFLRSLIEPRDTLLPLHVSPEARCLLLAIAGQESDWTERLPLLADPDGPRGFWRCARHGLVLRVVTAEATRADVHRVCTGLSIPPGLDSVHEAIAWNDTLAYCVARLALTLDGRPLPAIGDAAAAWEVYRQVWLPPEPDPGRWADRYAKAVELFPPVTEAPGYWMNETTGVLRPAVEAFLERGKLTGDAIAALRDYFRQWIASPVYAGPAIEELRASVELLDTRRALGEWVRRAAEVGVFLL